MDVGAVEGVKREVGRREDLGIGREVVSTPLSPSLSSPSSPSSALCPPSSPSPSSPLALSSTPSMTIGLPRKGVCVSADWREWAVWGWVWGESIEEGEKG
jgi:hypothetical protein